MRDGFVAGCRHCGAPHALVLLDPTAPCAFCRAADPLAPEARDRVFAAAEAICQLTAREQEQRRVHADAGFETGLVIALFGGASWLVFGGIAIALAFANKPADTSVLQLLGSDLATDGNGTGTDAVLAWWTFFLVIAGVLATVLTALLLLFVERAPLESERALSPLDPQSPPRCRLCGAGLAPTGTTRTCTSCGAANLVDGASFSAELTQLDEQLRWVAATFTERSTRVAKGSSALVQFTAFFPIVLLLGLPIGLLVVQRSMPELLPLLWVLAALVPVGSVAVALRKPAAVPSLRSYADGALVRVRARPYRVCGRIESTDDDFVGSHELTVLAPAHGAGPMLAIDQWGGPSGSRVVAYELHDGGAPYESTSLPLVSVLLRGAQGGVATLTKEPAPRLFVGTPQPGAAPRFRLAKLELTADQLVLL